MAGQQLTLGRTVRTADVVQACCARLAALTAAQGNAALGRAFGSQRVCKALQRLQDAARQGDMAATEQAAALVEQIVGEEVRSG